MLKMLALASTAFLLASPYAPYAPQAPRASQPVALTETEGETPFSRPSRTFATETACAAHLATWVRDSAPPTYVAAVGPYAITPGDTRAHRVAARDGGHEIDEHRCLGAALSARRWTHRMVDVKPVTFDDIRKMSFPAC